MALSTKYNPIEVEEKWYQEWMDQKLFHSEPNPNKPPYTVVIPPPNVTGVLHMGHMLNNTIQDVLIRKARMQGFEACWVPGTDHASIATEAKVVGMLREKGIKKKDLTRDEFLEHAWEWKEKYGGIILEQLKKLGASCDWDRTSFTMDDDYYKAVIRVFTDLHKKGYIYRGQRMINWDCEAQTALSNEEVIYKEDGDQATLYSVKYPIKDSDEWVTIATVRPETILGDSAIAVNPKDERYQHLIGKKAIVPFVNREIPIIADDYVDLEFGTGCLKVTPAHDPNDFEIGQRHGLEVIDTINNDGTLNEACGIEAYVGKDRFAVRKQIVKDLDAAGQLVGTEVFTTRIGRSERTNTVVEPKLSLQWFIKMKDISKKAMQAVEDDEIALIPAKFKNTYRHWMENVRDWCISRQLWWGHRIPAYYFGDGEHDYVIAESAEEALSLAREKSGNAALQADDIRQDSDVLDTWASSWLWPIQVFGGFNGDNFDKESGKYIPGTNKDLDYYYPTNVLVTAPEILFFWVARMIIAGYEYMDKRPFKDVYLTGIVRDKLRRKMSKSLGNSPDPLELMKQFGADGVRTGMLFSSPAGNDLLFDEKLCEQGRNFSNKIWNVFRLMQGWEISDNSPNTQHDIAAKWFESKFNQALAELEDHFSKYRISDALMTVYKLIWNDFSSWYLEIVKPAYGEAIDRNTYNTTIGYFEKLIKILHPFMPFISEELYQNISERKSGDYLMISEWPEKGTIDETLLKHAQHAFDVISGVRNLRSNKGLSPKEALELQIKAKDTDIYTTFEQVIKKMANLSDLNYVDHQEKGASGFIVDTDECFVPLSDNIDPEKELEELQKELAYQEGFLNSVNKKLSNEKFVNNAPEKVVAIEKKKRDDAEAKIKAIKEQITLLNS